jgi:hypothetical protein
MSAIAEHSFLLVALKLTELRKYTTTAAVKEALTTLSRQSSLAAVYEQSLSNIPEGNVNRAYSILRVMAAASRPLTLDELAEATAIDIENETFDYKRRPKDAFDVLGDLHMFVSVSG